MHLHPRTARLADPSYIRTLLYMYCAYVRHTVHVWVSISEYCFTLVYHLKICSQQIACSVCVVRACICLLMRQRTVINRLLWNRHTFALMLEGYFALQDRT